MSPNAARAGELAGQKLGKYELLSLLAVGGTAEIYLARIGGEAGFEKYLVVKGLLDHLADDPEFVKMFLDEARLGAQLDHSNIVQTLELGQHNGRYYMVMEYLAGMSLAQLARKTQERVAGGRLPIDLILSLAAQVCSGLHYAHERAVDGRHLNLVHRDVSPQNLVVTFEGVIKIVDFGIAKSDVRQTHTKTGTIKGKFAYMSPEQCLAQDIDRRTDIFALGAICHELLTGRRLFKRQTTYDTYQAIVGGGVQPPSSVNHEVDRNVDALVMKALAYKREDRFQTAEAFGEALLSTLHTRGASVGASDVSRYFESHFSDEIAAHGEQMRKLIEGKAKDNATGSWDEDAFGEARAAAGRAAQAAAGRAAEAAAERDLNQETREIAPVDAARDFRRIPNIALPSRSDDDDGDEGPTRIDFDPGQRIADLHRASTSDGEDEGDIDPTGETVLRDPTGQSTALEDGDTSDLSGPAAQARTAGPGSESRRTLLGAPSPLRQTPPHGVQPGGAHPGQPSSYGPPAHAATPSPFQAAPDTLSQPPQHGQQPHHPGYPQHHPGQHPQGPSPYGGPFTPAPVATPPPFASAQHGYPGQPFPGQPPVSAAAGAQPGTSAGVARKPALWLVLAVFLCSAGLGFGVTFLVSNLL